MAKLDEEIGLEHALASERVYTDGAEVIFDYAERSEDDAMLAVVRTGQRQLEQIIRGYLKQITYGGDGWAARLRLPAYAAAQVVVDPRQAFGQPSVVHGGARVEDLVDRFQAGDGLSEIADEFAEAGRRGRIVPMKSASPRCDPGLQSSGSLISGLIASRLPTTQAEAAGGRWDRGSYS